MRGLPRRAALANKPSNSNIGSPLLRTLFCVGVAAWLAGCSPDYSPNKYDSSAVQHANKVDQGVIVGRRMVDVTPSGTTGAVAGAAAGGIAGSQVGNGVTQAFGALGGGLVGGVMGEAIEKSSGKTFAYEYVVRVDSKDLVSVTQQDPKPLDIGQKVLVINGSQARIVPDYTVAIDPPPANKTDPTAKSPPPLAQTPLLPPGALTPDPAPAASASGAAAQTAASSPAPETQAPASSPVVPEVPAVKPGTEISPASLLPPAAALAPTQ